MTPNYVRKLNTTQNTGFNSITVRSETNGWADTWKMRFTVHKCKAMHFGEKKILGRNTYYQMEKDLEVYFDHRLRSSKQC